MASTNVKEIIYFVLIFILFYLAVKLSDFWVKRGNINRDISIMIVGIIYALVMVGLYFAGGLHKSVRDNYKNFDIVSPYARCRGGPYFWHGDLAFCNELASTPEGQCKIASFNCPNGYVGTPMLPFVYSSLSNDKWQNERCDKNPDCPCPYTGLCSMTSHDI